MYGPTRLRKLVATFAGGLAMMGVGATMHPPGAEARMTPQSEEEKTIYFLGVLTSRQARELGLSDTEAELMIQGLRDALDGKAIELDQAVYFPKLQELAQARHSVVLEREKADSALFLEKAGQTKGARVTASGLIITDIKVGTGESPGTTDTVRVHYHGTLRDGTVFDSSVQRGEPAEFPLNRVIPCWTEGVSLMKVGGKAKLVCPPDIAYGDRGAPPKIPGGAALTFEVELIAIVQPVVPE